MKKTILALSILSSTINYAGEVSDWSSAWTGENTRIQTAMSSTEDYAMSTDARRTPGQAMPYTSMFVAYPIMSGTIIPIVASADNKKYIARKMESAREQRSKTSAEKAMENAKIKFQKQIPIIKSALVKMFDDTKRYLENSINDPEEVKALESNFLRLAYNLSKNNPIIDVTVIPVSIEVVMRNEIKQDLLKENADDLNVEINQAYAMKLYCRKVIAYLDSIREKSSTEQNILLQ
jgi:hypothetical protein